MTLKKLSQRSILLFFLGGVYSWAADQEFQTLRERVALNYFSIVSGPELCCDWRMTPGQDGNPSDEGDNLFNIVSARYRISRQTSLDLQTRFTWVVTNSPKLRWESMRPVLGTQLYNNGQLTATALVNSDLPGPVATQTMRDRAFILNPGAFINTNYAFNGTPWSIFASVGPRFFIYEDLTVFEKGSQRGRKTQAALIISPMVNYAINPKLTATLGVYNENRKSVANRWGDWNRTFFQVYGGVSYMMSSYLTVFPYLQVHPIDGLGITTRNSFVGMWLNGTLF